MIELALKAGLPLICVQTDDSASAVRVLTELAGKPVQPLPKGVSMIKSSTVLYVSDDQEALTKNLYDHCQKNEYQVVFVNCKTEGLAFDAGTLLPPPTLVKKHLISLGVMKTQVEDVAALMKGLPLKSIEEIIRLTAAEVGNLSNIAAIRRMRHTLGSNIQGLYPLDADIGYYQVPQELQAYMTLQEKYFQSVKVPAFLRPKGIMFHGPPGTGKTMAAKYLSKMWKAPLYRVDIATTLSRWNGESEGRMMSILSMLDREEPCIALFDEVEKVFNTDAGDNAVIDRLLSQLLWWMQDHPTRVLVLMTSNDLSRVPPELYRQGRLDMVMKLDLLTLKEARQLSHKVLVDLVPKPTNKMVHTLTNAFAADNPDVPMFSPSQVTNTVIEWMKHEGWYTV